MDELVKEEAANRETNEASPKPEENKGSKTVEMKAGIGLCLIGVICLIVSGVMMVTSPGAAERLNAASTITISGSGILFVFCVLSMVVGLILILRKK